VASLPVPPVGAEALELPASVPPVSEAGASASLVADEAASPFALLL
jgi:hypothetical protein